LTVIAYAINIAATMNAARAPKPAPPKHEPPPERRLVAAQPPGFYRAQSYTAEDSVGYLMRRIMVCLAQQVERRLEPSGLTNAQWLPLFKLHLGVASTVAELARECELDAGSMTRLLDRLEAKALCRRVRSSDDRRVVHIELTSQGSAAARAIPAVLCEVQNRFLDGFSAPEWETLKTLLRRVLDNAQHLNLETTGDRSPSIGKSHE